MIFQNLSTRTLLKKSIASLIAFTFIFSNIVFADTPKTNTNLADLKNTEVITDPAKIVIPRDYGLVKAKYTGKDKRLIIHIQDAHCNYEAQSNIRNILETLIKNDGLKLISVEGADGFIDTSWFKAFPDVDIRKEVADYFMKKGEITGPEFLSITSDYPIKLFGAETRSYYIQNLNAFTSSYPLKESTEKSFNQIKAILNKLKTHIYNEELKTLDSKIRDYESKKLQFADYVKVLEAMAEKHRINLRQYESLFKLISVFVYEKKINFNVVDKERATLIDELTKKLTKEALTELVTKSLSFKTGKISSVEYYDYLKKLANHHGFELIKDYPNVFNYIIYNSVYSRIENEKLFSEIKKLEIAVKEKLFTNDDQRTLDKLSRDIDIILGLVNIKLLNDDFDYYKANKDEFTHEIFADFIKKMTIKYGFAFELDPPSDAVKESIPKLEEFYSIAIKRDKALVDNTLQAMKEENAQICVLVTGGFHSEGITKMLEGKGVSYMVVCPNITKDVETPYIKILTNQRTPLEDILTDTVVETKGKDGMLAPILVTWAGSLDEEHIRKMLSNVPSDAIGKDELQDLVNAIVGRLSATKRDFERKSIEAWIENALKVAESRHYEYNITAMKETYFYEMKAGIVDAKLREKETDLLSRGDPVPEGGAVLTKAEQSVIDGLVDGLARSEAFNKLFIEMYEKGLPGQIGAIRAKGGTLTSEEHGTRGKEIVNNNGEKSVNAIIRNLILKGNAYKVLNEGKVSDSDKDIELKINNAFKGLGVNIVVIKGLKQALLDNGVAPDLLLHPGIGRQSVYLDEEDFGYLLSLPNAVVLMTEAGSHEKAHIDNPNLSESEIEKMAPTYNVRMSLAKRDLEELKNLAQSANTPAVWTTVSERLMILSESLGLFYETMKNGFNKEQKAAFDKILVEKSVFARDVAGKLIALNNRDLLEKIAERTKVNMRSFLDGQIAISKITSAKAQSQFDTTAKFISQWLNPENKIPKHIVQGIYRGMLEARSADILYSFGQKDAGWVEFGTAGIRNPALESSTPAIQEQELKEFAQSPFAPVLTGTNCINVVSLLQQEAAVVRVMRKMQAMIAENNTDLANINPEFIEGIKGNRVTVSYDSRLNGEYFAVVLASAFLRDGVKVDLFDNAAGVPHLAWAANREKSAFGFLISASHSEANYNGFKVFLGYQMSQVDRAGKEMVVGARAGVGYKDMNLDLIGEGEDLGKILKHTGELRWIGGAGKIAGKDYYGRELVSFYPWYYGLVKARSPLAMLGEAEQKAVEALKSTRPLKALYTAFFGVGAVPAANFRKFLTEQCGYTSVDIVKSQTEVMDGMFPGHKSPDPGIVQGWIVNFVDYITQITGPDLSNVDKNIDKAIDALNEKEVCAATDPDIDRAGIALGLPVGMVGNIKNPLIKAFIQYLQRAELPQSKKEAIIQTVRGKMEAGLNDKLLLTANDAWTFMMYWKLKLMEESGKLEKDRVYIIAKSHVTTSALERVAKLYRDEGYKVYVVDTYVGFTEIGKKGRDLFTFAKLSGEASEQLRGQVTTRENIAVLRKTLSEFKKANAELKSNVPSQTAGVPIIEETIELLEKILNGETTLIDSLRKNLYALWGMHILAGVEESNGYGELGRWNRETGKVELNHINDKDGSLAVYEFMELLSYGAYKNMTGYDMYKKLISSIGMVCTVNSALYHPGLTGGQEKLDEIEGLEKLFAYVVQKRLDAGQAVKLFNDRYTVTKVEVYRDEKYDNSFLGFSEEGVRFYLKTKSGSEVITTYRPSGTGDSNRDYNWLLGAVPAKDVDLEKYREVIEKEMEIMVKDFFGIEGLETGYAQLSPKDFRGLMMALKEAGVSRQLETFGKALNEGSIQLTKYETSLFEAVKNYALAAKVVKERDAKAVARLAEARSANRAAWQEYLNSPEVAAMPNKIAFKINDKIVAQIPKAAMMSWQAGLVDYLIGIMEEEGVTEKNISFDNSEIMLLIGKRVSEKIKGYTIADKLHTPEAATKEVPSKRPKPAVKVSEQSKPTVETPEVGKKGGEAGTVKGAGEAAGKKEDTSKAPLTLILPSSRSKEEIETFVNTLKAEEINANITAPDIAALEDTAMQLMRGKDALIKDGKVIIISFTDISEADTGPVSVWTEKLIKEYLGDAVIHVRGSAKNVEEILSEVRGYLGTEKIRSIVTIGGDKALKAMTEDGKILESVLKDIHEKSKVLNIQSKDADEKPLFISIPAIENLALSIGFEMPEEKIMRCLQNVGIVINDKGNPLDPIALLTQKIVRILPRIKPIDVDADTRAQNMARKALERSL